MEILFHIVEDRARLDEISPRALEELTALARVVRAGSHPVSEESVGRFFGHGGVLSLAATGESIVGAACLVKVFKYNGVSFRLEHVSVLPAYEGNGIARRLIKRLHLVAGEGGYIDLTCEPFRERANRLYESLGYELRPTNPRRLRLPGATR